MKRIISIVNSTLPKQFTRKEFSFTIRELSNTAHPEYYLQLLIDRGIIKHGAKGEYWVA